MHRLYNCSFPSRNEVYFTPYTKSIIERTDRMYPLSKVELHNIQS